MIKSKQLAQAIFELSEEKVLDLDVKFFDFLKKRNLEAQMQSVLYHLEKIIEIDLEKKGIQIEVAHNISQDTVSRIKHFLEKNSSEGEGLSQKKEIIRIKQELLGGFRAKYNGVVYDSSIISGLKKLEKLIIS